MLEIGALGVLTAYPLLRIEGFSLVNLLSLESLVLGAYPLLFGGLSAGLLSLG